MAPPPPAMHMQTYNNGVCSNLVARVDLIYLSALKFSVYKDVPAAIHGELILQSVVLRDVCRGPHWNIFVSASS